jgi:hypothetical protein
VYVDIQVHTRAYSEYFPTIHYILGWIDEIEKYEYKVAWGLKMCQILKNY